jgi:hypothetical protein
VRTHPEFIPPLQRGARRERQQAFSRVGLVQGLLREFALSSHEGAVLTCPTEAPRRVVGRGGEPLVRKGVEAHSDAVLLHGDAARRLEGAAVLAQRPGPIVSLQANDSGDAAVPLQRLVVEHARCRSTPPPRAATPA